MSLQLIETFFESNNLIIYDFHSYKIVRDNTSINIFELFENQKEEHIGLDDFNVDNILIAIQQNFINLIIETSGRLIAHEIANPLTALSMNIEFLHQLFDDSQDKLVEDTIISTNNNINQIRNILDIIRFPQSLISQDVHQLTRKDFVKLVGKTLLEIDFMDIYIFVRKDVSIYPLFPVELMYILQLFQIDIISELKTSILLILNKAHQKLFYTFYLKDTSNILELPLKNPFKKRPLNKFLWYLNFIEKTIAKIDGKIKIDKDGDMLEITLVFHKPEV